jgi:hypothetical protein
MGRCSTLLLPNHQTIEEGAVALQRLTEIFSGDILALIPLAFQGAMFSGKHLGDLLDHLRYQRIRLLDSRARGSSTSLPWISFQRVRKCSDSSRFSRAADDPGFVPIGVSWAIACPLGQRQHRSRPSASRGQEPHPPGLSRQKDQNPLPGRSCPCRFPQRSLRYRCVLQSAFIHLFFPSTTTASLSRSSLNRDR